MFTGIIEAIGEIKEVSSTGSNKSFWIRSPFAAELKPDQSVAHDGVCLTVEDIKGDLHKVTAISESLKKTAMNQWKPGTRVNLERALMAGSRLDGHFVQGHVDTTGSCEKISDQNGSTEYTFSFPKEFNQLIIEKGSIAVNGISLTAFNVKKKEFTVAIIPFTKEHTNLGDLKTGMDVNLEFDILGKYILKSRS